MFLKVKGANEFWYFLNVKNIDYISGADYGVKIIIKQDMIDLLDYRMNTIENAIEHALENPTKVVVSRPDR